MAHDGPPLARIEPTCVARLVPQAAAGRTRHAARSIRCFLPEKHGRVSAPGTPRFGAALDLELAARTHRSAKNQVACGEGIGRPARAHQDVLRRPFTDSRDVSETRHRPIEVGARV
jgi:hypothetical protein